ncbi:MAG: hypothetical protein ACE5R4_07515 [Armatimonadota bacterium]
MYRRAYFTCHSCKCEFFLELNQLQANPDRACPNCGQRFDLVGMSNVAQALALLEEARSAVTFQLQEARDLRRIMRVLQLPALAQGQLEQTV